MQKLVGCPKRGTVLPRPRPRLRVLILVVGPIVQVLVSWDVALRSSYVTGGVVVCGGNHCDGYGGATVTNYCKEMFATKYSCEWKEPSEY